MPDLLSGLGRAWRLLGTAFSFALFGVGGLFLGLLVFPLLFVLQRDPRKRQRISRRCIGASFSLFIAVMKFLGVLQYEIIHPERLRNHSGTLIIANHPSLIDVVFLIAFFPQAECVVKSAVTRNFFMRNVANAANYISNQDPQKLISTCIERLQQGSNLILFPEATRTVPQQPLQFKIGAATVAARSGSAILPIFIRCSTATLAKGEPWYHIPKKQPRWVLEVLPVLHVDCPLPGLAAQRQVTRDLNETLRFLFTEKLASPDQPG